MATRHSLLIGVPRYEDPEFGDDRLGAAVTADVSAMRDVLEQSGYAITECGLDEAHGEATPTRIRRAIRTACTEVPAGGVLLIYFSGHGLTVGGQDFLVPTDAYRADVLSDTNSLVPVVPDHGVLRECRAALVAFFVDACRNESTEESSGGGPASVEPGGEQPYLADGGQFVLVMGCGAGQTCGYDESGSVFTQALAKVLDPRNPARTLAEVLDSVATDMSRRSRQHPDLAQEPVIRNPAVLDRAGKILICDGDELGAAWRKAVDASPLLALCPDPDRVRHVVAECARRCGAAQDTLRKRTGLADPWTDQNYPGRVMRIAELLLRDAEVLPGEAAMLIATPFLREAVLAQGIREAAGVDPANFNRTYTPGARGDLELTHEMHQHLVRRATALQQGGSAEAANRLAVWLVHQWLDGRVRLWEGAGAREVYELGRPLIEDSRGNADRDEVPLLVQALILAVGAEPADERLLGKLGREYVDDRWRSVAAVLWLVGIVAADLRKLPPIVPDLVGTGMELPLVDVQDAASRLAAWELDDETGTLRLRLACEHPALHDAFEDIVRRAVRATETIGSRLALRAGMASRLPRQFSADGLRPKTVRGSIGEAEERAYEVPLSRFQIAEEKVRELLMGRQLYGDPSLAIRELYQNALDACRWRATRQEYLTRTDRDPAPWAGLIQFRQGVDAGGRAYIECEDNGVGMDINTLKHVFANAGERFVYGQEFRAEQADWADLEPPLKMVSNSQFGVGVFSYFMLADEITVSTRHQRRDGVVEGQAYEVRIVSSGSLFQIKPVAGLTAGGTRVRLYLNVDTLRVSALETLRSLLAIAEHKVTVTDPDGRKTWEAGELQYTREGVKPLKCGDDLWWVPGDGGLAADGIWTSVGCFGLVVNLRGEHRPQFTVDRKTLRSWDEDWILEQVDAARPELMNWPGFTLDWIWIMTARDPTLAQRIFDYAVAVDQSVPARGSQETFPLPGSQMEYLMSLSREYLMPLSREYLMPLSREYLMPLSMVGCVPTDFVFLSANSWEPREGDDEGALLRWLITWRENVWQKIGSLSNLRFADFNQAMLAGFPAPDPLDGFVLSNILERVLALYFSRLSFEYREIFEEGRQPRAISTDISKHDVVASLHRDRYLRRFRKYAITGLDVSAMRPQNYEHTFMRPFPNVADWFYRDDGLYSWSGLDQNWLIGDNLLLTTNPVQLTQVMKPNPHASRPSLSLADLVAVAFRLGTTLGTAALAVRENSPEIEFPSLPAECTSLNVPHDIFGTLLDLPRERSRELIGFGETIPCKFVWRLLGPYPIVCGAVKAGKPLGDYLGLLDPFRQLGAPVPAFDEAIRAALNQPELDANEGVMLYQKGGSGSSAGLRTVTALQLVQIAGCFGWTLAYAHRRLSRLTALGLSLKYPDIELPDEIVRWQDLLLLTTHFDGQQPVISGRIDQPYLERAAEEIFDAAPGEFGGHAAWLRSRLKLYAALFELEVREEDADV